MCYMGKTHRESKVPCFETTGMQHDSSTGRGICNGPWVLAIDLLPWRKKASLVGMALAIGYLEITSTLW